jgi:uncharacterized protein YdhG (YjbR/CyaY superfamily)
MTNKSTTKSKNVAKRSTVTSIEEYVASFPAETQKALKQLRTLIKSAARGATEKISYGIIGFSLNGRYLVYIAGWKNHVGFYPVIGETAKAFKEEIKPYQSGKASLQFPLSEPMPKDLIRRIVKFKAQELTGKNK